MSKLGKGPEARESMAVQVVWQGWGGDEGGWVGWWTWPRLRNALTAVEGLYMAPYLVYSKMGRD